MIYKYIYLYGLRIQWAHLVPCCTWLSLKLQWCEYNTNKNLNILLELYTSELVARICSLHIPLLLSSLLISVLILHNNSLLERREREGLVGCSCRVPWKCVLVVVALERENVIHLTFVPSLWRLAGHTIFMGGFCGFTPERNSSVTSANQFNQSFSWQ